MAMTKDELRAWLTEKGYKKDRYGSFKGSRPDGRPVRFKLKRLVVRYEGQISDGSWFRILSGYYGELSIDDRGRLQGLRR